MFESGLVAGSYVAAKAKLAEPERKPIPIWDINKQKEFVFTLDTAPDPKVKWLFSPGENFYRTSIVHQDDEISFGDIVKLDNEISFEDIESFGIFYKKNDDRKLKQKKKETVQVSNLPGGLEPDSDEEREFKEESKRKRYKYSDYERGDDVGLERFTERFEKTKLRDPKSGQYIEKDRAVNSGSGAHGPSYWKLFDKAGKKIATLSEKGIVYKLK